MKKFLFILIFLNINLQAEESFLNFNSYIEESWQKGIGIEKDCLDRNKSIKCEGMPKQSVKRKLIFEEKCSKKYDVFCYLYEKILNDSPPEWDEWLTEDENLAARKTYYSKKKIQSVELKLPIKLSLCDDTRDFKADGDIRYWSNKVVFENGAKARGLRGTFCYSIEREKIFGYFKPEDTFIAGMTFDVPNPHGKYCKPPNIIFNIAKSYNECYEFENNEKMAEANRIFDNGINSDLSRDKRVKHLVSDISFGSYNADLNGYDFQRFLMISQKISHQYVKTNVINEPLGSFHAITNYLHVFHKNGLDFPGQIPKGDLDFLEFSAERSFVKENFDNIKLYVVITIPLAQKQLIIGDKRSPGLIKPGAPFRERDYFGYFKGYELILDNSILACTYNCDISK